MFAAVVSAMLLKVAVLPLVADQDAFGALLDAHRASFIAAWVAWGAVLAVWGIVARSTLRVFLGTGFMVVPLVEFMAVDVFPEGVFLAVLLMACGLPLFLVGMVRRKTVRGRPRPDG